MIDIDLQRVLNVGISLSTEKNRNKLLELIITEAMAISHADGGTLYTYENDLLKFKIMRNISLNTYQGGGGEDVNLPPVPMKKENVCSFCAIMRKTVNIADVYSCDEFDFSGPKKYDSITNYRTKSMMVVPFQNTLGDIIGVLQLINSTDENGNVVPFSDDIETIITSLAAQAAIAITNAMYLHDIKDLFQSFVQVMITAIDELSPYNVNHTRKITEYADKFIDYLNTLYAEKKYPEFFDENRKEQLIMGAWMHDIGKLITPLEVMNKATRLSDEFPVVLEHFDIAKAMAKIKFLEHKCTEEEYLSEIAELDDYKDFIAFVNSVPYLDDDALAKLNIIREKYYEFIDGEKSFLIRPSDYECLSVRRGTLTDKERSTMQNHVVLTSKLLSNIKFGSNLKDVPKIASMHHEFLNGTGYPKGASGDELSLEVRILSILDIIEALTSSDRPYKKTMSSHSAFEILKGMVDEGKLDSDVVDLLEQSGVIEELNGMKP